MTVPTLTEKQINDLAGVGLGMVWAEGVPENITAVQLAAHLLNLLATNVTSYNGYPIIDIMRNSTRNSTLDTIAAEKILAAYALMPMTVRHGLAAFWILMVVFSGPMLALRLYSRIKYSGGLRKDDYFLTIGWVIAAWGNIDGVWLLLAQNFGAHGWNCTRKQLEWHFHLGAIDDMIVAVFSFFYKTALLIFFYDIYPHRTFRMCVWAIGVLILIWTAGFEVFLYYRCKPWADWTNPFKAVCIPQALALFQAANILNIVIDVLIFALPCWIVYNMNTKLREKIQVAALMGLGLVVCVASIMRYTTLERWVTSLDVQWRAIDISTWCMLEPHLGIFCACVPAVRKAVLHMIPGIKAFMESHGIGGPWSPKNSPLSTKNSTIGSFVGPVPAGNEKKKPPPPVGELTAIMNMRTADLESGMGTVMMHEPVYEDQRIEEKGDVDEKAVSLHELEKQPSSSSL